MKERLRNNDKKINPFSDRRMAMFETYGYSYFIMINYATILP